MAYKVRCRSAANYKQASLKAMEMHMMSQGQCPLSEDVRQICAGWQRLYSDLTSRSFHFKVNYFVSL